MKTIKYKSLIGDGVYRKVRDFLEKEGIEGEFKIVKDEDIKNGYTVLIKMKNTENFEERVHKAYELNKKGAYLIPGKYLFYMIQPS
ncbi:hypothetical protein [Persephonella sp.]